MGVWVDTRSDDGVVRSWQGPFFLFSEVTFFSKKHIFLGFWEKKGQKWLPEFKLLVKMAPWTL